MTVGHFAMGLIRWMTQKDPKKRPELSEVICHLKLVQPMKTENLKAVGKIQFSRAHFLAKGGYGNVYLGRCEHPDCKEVDVVIKRIQLVEEKKSIAINRELTALRNLKHSNIGKFFDSELDDDFM
jgi:serine/threonine protein kinase